jgi:hypothetical protein
MYVANAGQYQLAIAVRIPDSSVAVRTCFALLSMLQLDENVLMLNTRHSKFAFCKAEWLKRC